MLRRRLRGIPRPAAFHLFQPPQIRRHNMKQIRNWVAALALGLVFAGSVWAQAAVKVGVIFPLSGGAGPQGQHVSQAIQTMAALINESRGVLGRKIEIVTRDDESTPAVGVS